MPWNLTQFSQSPSAAPLYFPESHWESEISSLLKVILTLGKSRSHRAPNLGCSGAESPGWFDVLPQTSAWDVMCDGVPCDEAANHQLPIAVIFWIISIVSTGECSSLMQNLMHIFCSSHSVILNAMATQYTRSLNGIYWPHWLVQWSCHCSHMRILVHSPWLPGYMDVGQIILVIVTMVGLSLERSHISSGSQEFYVLKWFYELCSPRI